MRGDCESGQFQSLKGSLSGLEKCVVKVEDDTLYFRGSEVYRILAVRLRPSICEPSLSQAVVKVEVKIINRDSFSSLGE